MQALLYWQDFKATCLYLEIPHRPLKKRFMNLEPEAQEVMSAVLKALCMAIDIGLDFDKSISETLPKLFESMEKGEARAVKQWALSMPMGGAIS